MEIKHPSVIFIGQDFLICNKPAGVNVHNEAVDDTAGTNKIGFCESVRSELQLERLYIVHRLDKETSGLIIFALTKETASKFGKLFEEKKITKKYIALTHSKPSKKQGKIIGDMKKARDGSWKLTKAKTNPAITTFDSVGYSVDDVSLRMMLLKPITGKTHQLRVALKSLGSPILGDERYKGLVADRLYLHAYELNFEINSQSLHFYQLPSPSQYFNDTSIQTSLNFIASKHEQ